MYQVHAITLHQGPVQPLVIAIPFAKPAMSCLDFLTLHPLYLDWIGDLGLAQRELATGTEES